MPAVDITNQRFGRLVAIRSTDDRGQNREIIWECKCDCGATVFIPRKRLTTGGAKSCGCSRTEKARKNYKQAAAISTTNNVVEGTDLRALNKKKAKNNTSGRKGVYWVGKKQRWRASITFKGKYYSLGYFDDFEKAVQAREKAEEKYFVPMQEKYRRTNHVQ